MFAAIIFCVSVVATCHCCIYYWRALMLTVAAQPVSDRLRAVVAPDGTTGNATDFRMLVNLNEIAPSLSGSGNHLRIIRAYWFVLDHTQRIIPSAARWCEMEMTTCARYVEVLFDQNLQRNQPAWRKFIAT